MLAVADWTALVALAIAAAGLAWQVVTRIRDRDESKRRDAEGRALRQSQTEALTQIARATQELGMRRDEAQGAELSASIAGMTSVSVGSVTRRLSITNLGPGAAQLIQFDVVGQGSAVVVGEKGIEGGRQI